MAKARSRGVKVPDAALRKSLHNLRSDMRKVLGVPAGKSGAVPTPPAPSAPEAPAIKDVFANVALVNRVVGASGGVANARQVAEAVRKCGGVEAFLQHLDLVAGIREAE